MDTAQTQAVYLDYHNNLSSTADASGNVATVTLTIPAGTAVPEQMDAIVLADVFPLFRKSLAP